MQTLTFLFAFIAVLALIGVAAWLVRRFATNRLGANTNRGRMPRLAVIDAAAVDGRRRLVLVRRDNVEHLLMIGGPSDIVVEPNIVRAIPGRDQMAPRPAVAGEAPPRIAPLPDANWNDDAARTDLRSADAFDHHAEPQMPEPPPRPARPSFADEVRRPAPPPMPERRSDRADPLAGFAPEPMGSRPEPRPEPAPPRLTRTEPLMPRPQRASEPPKEAFKAPPPIRAPERAVAPPPPPLSRPLRPRSRAPTRISPRWRSGSKPLCAGRPNPWHRRSPPSRRRCGPRAPKRPPPRRRRAALRIWKTRWHHCWAVQSRLREIGDLPA